ncbi:MAG: hypothetical protein HOM11_12335 [Methylococcales bacterium]|jgi:hypothetical protein|nr:hypothetical protein [Methylococcales bacterium]MBT7443987.1 hypothetical protein [Methylococcales bacterium]
MKRIIAIATLLLISPTHASNPASFTDAQIMSMSASVVVEQANHMQKFCKEFSPKNDLTQSVAILTKHRDKVYKVTNSPELETLKEHSLNQLKVYTIRFRAQGSEALLCGGLQDNWVKTTEEQFKLMAKEAFPQVKAMLASQAK